MSKRSAKSRAAKIFRHNLSFDPVVRVRGEQLATEDKRSFSAECAWLIDAEWQRRRDLELARERQEVAA